MKELLNLLGEVSYTFQHLLRNSSPAAFVIIVGVGFGVVVLGVVAVVVFMVVTVVGGFVNFAIEATANENENLKSMPTL